jgi:ABC-type sugar transport system ATPase subunit
MENAEGKDRGILLELCGLQKEFDGFAAVEGLDLTIVEGEFICFLGPSGCGKTTTLRMIAGLETPTSGEIYLRGRKINDLIPQQRGVGLVFQNYALFWHMTVYDNLAFGLRIRGVSREEMDKYVKDVAERFELESLLNIKARRLDLSAMQRVAVARTLLTDPHLLLFDEPLNNIRPGLREMLRAELKRLQKELNRTMIYVTHDQEEAMTLGDRILVMNAGKVEQLDTPRQIYLHPRTLFVADFIGRPSMNFMETEYEMKGEKISFKWSGFSFNIEKKDLDVEEKHLKGKKLIVGIRPEHILLADEAEKGGISAEPLSAMVDLIQPLGAKKIIDLKSGDHMVKMVSSSEYSFKRGDRISVIFDPRRIHLFDPKDGRVIL